MKTTAKNAQDATLRNVRAAQRKIADLLTRVETLEETMHAVQTQIASLALPTGGTGASLALPTEAPAPEADATPPAADDEFSRFSSISVPFSALYRELP